MPHRPPSKLGVTPERKLVSLGVIVGVHGVRGRVKIRSYTAVPDAITRYGALTDKDGAREFSLRIAGRLKELLIAEIAGVTRREQAECLRGVELCVPREQLQEPEEDGAYLIEDVVGREVRLADGTLHATVKSVHNYGAGDLLELQPVGGGETELVTFTGENFPEVTERALTFRPPEILRISPDAVKKREKTAKGSLNRNIH